MGFRGLDDVRDLLGIPDAHEVLAIVPFGYPADSVGRGSKRRKTLAEVAHWERFGQPFEWDPHLLTDTARELALFGGRLVLAQNRLLDPGRNHVLRQPERAAGKPDRFMWLRRGLLRQPSITTAEAFC